MLYRELRLFCKSLWAIVLLVLVLAAVCAAAVGLMVSGQTGENLSVTVSVANLDTDSALGTMALELVQEHEVVEALGQVNVYGSEEEAVEALKQGAAAAVIRPEGFFSGVMTGENLPCRLILSSESQLLRDTISLYGAVGADILTVAQSAVYGGLSYLEKAGADTEVLSEYTLYLNGATLSQASRGMEQYFTEICLPYTEEGLGMEQHYMVLYLAFFLSVLGVGFSGFYEKDLSRETWNRLKSCGVGPGRFLMWKLILPGILFFAILGLWSGLFYDDWKFSWLGITGALAGVIFLACFACLGVLGLGLGGGGVLTALSVAGLLLMGGIIPYSMLSPAALFLGSLTPVGAAYGLFSGIMGGRIPIEAPVVCALYLLIGIGLTLRKMARISVGREEL